jgi:presenilin-like A22 family membrane protease
MKHSLKIVVLILAMFFITQLIGLYVVNFYSPVNSTAIQNGTSVNVTTHNLPAMFEPPSETEPQNYFYSIIFSMVFAIILILILIKIKAELFLRIWFLIVIVIALSLAINSIIRIPNSFYLALILAIPLALLKVFHRNIIVHNLTELLIYPGIAAIFVPLLNLSTAIWLFILISIYDIYAVWHAGFMQKMAKYQIQKVKVFSGFFIPYMGKKEKELLLRNSKSKSSKIRNKKVKVNIAILGGGDVVFPIILAGVVLWAFGLIPALLVSIGATVALGLLFAASRKGKFYPAMPFITAGCFTSLLIIYFFF